MHILHLSTAKNLLLLFLTQYATIIIGGEWSFIVRDMRDALSLIFSFHLNSPPTHTHRQGLEPLPSSEGCGAVRYVTRMAQDDNDKGLNATTT
jgi:hypothetical protein